MRSHAARRKGKSIAELRTARPLDRYPSSFERFFHEALPCPWALLNLAQGRYLSKCQLGQGTIGVNWGRTPQVSSFGSFGDAHPNWGVSGVVSFGYALNSVNSEHWSSPKSAHRT